jgi:Flp pilus assembly protein TadG
LIFKLLKNDKGSTIVIVTLMFTALMAFCAFTIDIGRVALEKANMQNAIDASTIAGAQFLPDTVKARNAANEYIVKNGYSPSNISISFSNSNKNITINGSKIIEYTFAKILGFQTTTIKPLAVAQMGSVGAAFNYAIFSGSDSSQLTIDTTLVINGSTQYVFGSTHSNASFVANGSNITITGACEAVGSVTVHGSSIDIGSRLPSSAFVPMPDFSDSIKQQAIAAGQFYDGNKIFNSSNLYISQPIYVNGDVTVNGCKFIGKGCILATGNINFNGSNLNYSSTDAVCFYSKTGDITINGSDATLDGILYAPKGSITMNGSHQTVNGRAIGNTVTFNGSHLSVISGTNELNSLPSSSVKLIS